MIYYRIRLIGQSHAEEMDDIFAIDSTNCDKDVGSRKLYIRCRFDADHFSGSQFDQIPRKLRIQLIVLDGRIYRRFENCENRQSYPRWGFHFTAYK